MGSSPAWITPNPADQPNEARIKFSHRGQAVEKIVPVSNKTKVDRFTNELEDLLKAGSAAQADGFGSPQWRLDEAGDAINRYLIFNSESDADSFITAVQEAADKANHHPSIVKELLQQSDEACLIIVVCSTHRPPGLSMRDIRLARSIDELVASLNTLTSIGEVDELQKKRDEMLRPLQKEREALLKLG